MEKYIFTNFHHILHFSTFICIIYFYIKNYIGLSADAPITQKVVLMCFLHMLNVH